MNMEEEIFKRTSANYNKLIKYGFKLNGDKYYYSKNILDNSFRIDIEVKENGIVTGKVIELSFNEEYKNFRVKNITGNFASNIRDEFEKILLDIKDKCFEKNYFISSQANRIMNLIIQKYNDIPEFPWKKAPGAGIIRNPNNDKWYGLIMDIPRSKLEDASGNVEIINVKLDEKEIEQLLKEKGFYKAYHMNKEKWISIILDNTLSDEEIMKYIEESHRYTEKPNEWIIPANPKYYDVIKYFNDCDIIDWKQSNNIKVGDMIYLYVAVPYSAILYKCEVLEVDIPYDYEDKNLTMKKVMKIKLLKKYDKDKYTFSKLNEYGIRAIRGPRSMPIELSKDINKF